MYKCIIIPYLSPLQYLQILSLVVRLKMVSSSIDSKHNYQMYYIKYAIYTLHEIFSLLFLIFLATCTCILFLTTDGKASLWLASLLSACICYVAMETTGHAHFDYLM